MRVPARQNRKSVSPTGILLGHIKIENTVLYLGMDVKDALELAEGTET